MSQAPLADHAALRSALELHGGLLPSEVQALGMTLAQADQMDGLRRVETAVGPLYFAQERRRARGEAGRGITGRTSSAAIDGAYLRLFMARTPGEWSVTSPHTLGLLHEDTSRLPAVRLGKDTYRVNGKVLGGGIAPRNLRRYLIIHAPTFRTSRSRLLIVGPSAQRYSQLAGLYPALLTLAQYTAEEARADNLAAPAFLKPPLPPQEHA